MRKIIFIALALAVAFALCACGNAAEISVSSEPETEAVEMSAQRGYIEDKPVETLVPTADPIRLDLPMELGDGLLLKSLFSSDVMNPDCGNSYGCDIATAELTNNSDRVIESAKIEVELSDGSTMIFCLAYIPAGKTVWAFSVDNDVLKSELFVTDVACTVRFADALDLCEENVTVSVNEYSVVLNNKTSNVIADAAVCCHCVVDDIYFGGTVFTYNSGELAAYSGTIIEAADCMLGTAEVVHIEIN